MKGRGIQKAMSEVYKQRESLPGSLSLQEGTELGCHFSK